MGLEGRDAGLQGLAQVEGLDLHRDIALLQTGDLQDVVDQGQQLLAGRADLVQIAHHLLPVTVGLEGQPRHADDDVQRGAHVVAHDGEELLLGFLALLRGGQGPLQQIHLLLLLLLLVLHVPEADHRLVGDLDRVGEHPDADPALAPVRLEKELAAEVPDLLVQQTSDVLQREAVREVLSRPLVQAGDDHLHQIGVIPLLLVEGPLDEVRALGHLEGACLDVDPVDRVVHIA